jgi:hypothetical protein
MLPLLCHSGCKEGIPIPFIGFVCTGMSDLCSPFGVIGEAVTITTGIHDRSHNESPERAKSGCGSCGCEGCSK